MKLLTATVTMITTVLLISSVHALGLITYYGSNPMYIEQSQAVEQHFYSFEVQNADDEDKDITVEVESNIGYIEIPEYTVKAKTSKKITLTIKFPSGKEYQNGDYGTVRYYVMEKLEGNGQVSVKKSLSGELTVIIGYEGQEQIRHFTETPQQSGDSPSSPPIEETNIIYIPPVDEELPEPVEKPDQINYDRDGNQIIGDSPAQTPDISEDEEPKPQQANALGILLAFIVVVVVIAGSYVVYEKWL